MQACISSFSLGIVINHMKLVLITKVYKGKSKLDICNYRPISVLTILNKVSEKSMLMD